MKVDERDKYYVKIRTSMERRMQFLVMEFLFFNFFDSFLWKLTAIKSL